MRTCSADPVKTSFLTATDVRPTQTETSFASLAQRPSQTELSSNMPPTLKTTAGSNPVASLDAPLPPPQPISDVMPVLVSADTLFSMENVSKDLASLLVTKEPTLHLAPVLSEPSLAAESVSAAKTITQNVSLAHPLLAISADTRPMKLLLSKFQSMELFLMSVSQQLLTATLIARQPDSAQLVWLTLM